MHVASPLEVQAVLEGLKYSRQYLPKVRSAQVSLESGEATCLEAVFIAAMLMEDLGFPPKVLALDTTDDVGHAVYMYQTKEGYSSLGRSSSPELQARPEPYKTVRDLAASYREGLRTVGNTLWRFGELDLRDHFGNWKTSREDLSRIQRSLTASAHQRIDEPKPLTDEQIRDIARSILDEDARQKRPYWQRGD